MIREKIFPVFGFFTNGKGKRYDRGTLNDAEQ
jgi:hypothetical protein